MTFDERAQAVAAFGFTERQARFLVTVMLHGGVCLGRQYCAFGQIARGQKMVDFFTKLVDRKYATRCVHAHRAAHLYHVHYKGLYAAIGEPNNRNRRAVPLPRAIERLMLLDGVLAARDVKWLATERDKVEHFSRATRLRSHELPHVRFGCEPNVTVRYFPDKLPIGLDADGRTHVFLYLVTRRSPVEFRAFLHRHAELFRSLSGWTVRLLFPRNLAGANGAYRDAVRDELATPLQPETVDELRWYFNELRRGVASAALVADGRFQQAQTAFSTPRFRTLYRMWSVYGDSALHATLSPVLEEALARRAGQLDCDVLAHPYQGLESLVGTA
jgi:hypothetical protein